MKVSVATAATATGVPIRTIRRWVTAGRLTAVRRGHDWLVNPLEVAELDELREQQGGRLTCW